MSASKQKGTRAETAVVEYLRGIGFKNTERRTLRGAKDAGDIFIPGLPGVLVEVKNAQRMELAAWVDEALKELSNMPLENHGHLAVVWHHRRGKASPADWYVTMTGLDFASLLLDLIEPEEA